jgi:hypothetical protein
MKLTRHEIILIAAVILTLAMGTLVKRFRAAHPVPVVPVVPPKAVSQK